MQVKNILVPVDFSACSKNALKIAIGIAKQSGAKIHMLNAIHVHAPHPDISGGGLIHTLISDYEAQVKESFDALESEVIELNNVPHESDRFISFLVDAIYSETKDKKIDLIIMGTRAEHSSIEKFLGSNTTDVISNAEVPVLIIPEKTMTFNPGKIGFASDFEGMMNFKNLEILSWFANTFHSEILIFHVSNNPDDISMKTQKMMKDLHEKFMDQKASVRTIESDSVLQGIKSFTSDHKLELLSMVPKEHSFFEKLFHKSITKAVALNPSLPILTIPQF